MHGKFRIVVVLLVTTSSTDAVVYKRITELVAILKEKLGKLVTTVSPLKRAIMF